ncbi:DUF1206 domain-containing protein [Alteromonas sp. ASW11-130]|uniref:DUF1206 domain-containing protein n=1 Tax=Alteromonas sp. ASW11-130 TaxID=3015775 RepID=UPI002241BD0D|nr:DUF1206 domain-containing protein [Alteromonas sp. ASW11-130]MCW8093380.1 DUF1206 domain-containing protein [Alteromonas sp. ASW11-130]
MADHETWIKYIARTGYASKTVLYIMLGVIVVSSAFSAFTSSGSPSKKTVFTNILEQPFGRYLLMAVIAGMICYSLWRWIQCFLNTEELDMEKAKDIIMRVFLFISGVLYFLGAYAAVKILMGQRGSNGGGESGGDNSSENIAATLMEQSWGGYVVMALGIIIIIFAIVQFKHAWKCDFMDKFVTQNMSSKEIEASKKAGRIGYAARGIIYSVIGVFFLQAGWSHDPEEAGGLKEAFQSLMEQPFGDWLLMAVGIGIVLFGVFCGFEALYRQTDKKSNPAHA